MRTPAINFASALDQRRVRRVSTPALLLGGLALALLGVFSWQVAALEARHAALRMEIGLLEQARARQARGAKAPRIGRDATVSINQAIRQLNLPWPQIFETLERATPGSVAVLALTPEARSGTLALVGESRDTDAMLAYVRALKAEPLFAEVSISRHEINNKDPHKPVRFEVAARWRPQQ